MTKVYHYANYPTPCLTDFGCSCYVYSEVKDFIKPECLERFKKESSYQFREYNYYIPCSYVDVTAYLEHHELLGAIESADRALLKVRIRDGYKSPKGRDWSGLRGELIGSQVNVRFSHNQYAMHEIDHKYLILA